MLTNIHHTAEKTVSTRCQRMLADFRCTAEATVSSQWRMSVDMHCIAGSTASCWWCIPVITQCAACT